MPPLDDVPVAPEVLGDVPDDVEELLPVLSVVDEVSLLGCDFELELADPEGVEDVCD